MSTKEITDQKLKLPYRLAISCIIGGMILLIISFILILMSNKFFANYNQFIIGIVGALWALAGVLLFYNAIRVQQIEIITQTKELSLQRKEFRTQNDITNYNLVFSVLTDLFKEINQAEKDLEVTIFNTKYCGSEAINALHCLFPSKGHWVPMFTYGDKKFPEMLKKINKNYKPDYHKEFVKEALDLINTYLSNANALKNYVEKVDLIFDSIDKTLKHSSLSQPQINLMKSIFKDYFGYKRSIVHNKIYNMSSLYWVCSKYKWINKHFVEIDERYSYRLNQNNIAKSYRHENIEVAEKLF